MIITVIATIVVLGILIFVHELGHFILSKKMGVKVLKFSLGFGPKLIGKKIGETEYQIAIFPLGGFVKPLGEDPHEEISEEERPRSYWAQPIWKRALIIGAGPFFNFFLAIVIFSVINIIVGVPLPPSSRIGEVSPGLPAESAGLKSGDWVLSVDGEEVTRWDDLSKIIRSSKGKDLLLKIKRNDEILEIKVTPKPTVQKNLFGEEIQTFVIGITPFNEVAVQKVNPLRAIGSGMLQTWQGIQVMVIGIVKIIQRVIPAKEVGSLIMIGKLAGEQAQKGIIELAFFTAIISINLGLINLFPVPILDGGHFLFLLLEAILRKPLSIKKMEIAQQIGFIFLIFLMLFAFYNDLIRYVFPGGFKF